MHDYKNKQKKYYNKNRHNNKNNRYNEQMINFNDFDLELKSQLIKKDLKNIAYKYDSNLYEIISIAGFDLISYWLENNNTNKKELLESINSLLLSAVEISNAAIETIIENDKEDDYITPDKLLNYFLLSYIIMFEKLKETN